MARWLLNVAVLCGKEFRSLSRDAVLIALILFAFSVAVVTVAYGVKVEVSNATVAFVDEDHSVLSARLRDVILPPYFKPPVLTDPDSAARGMDRGAYIFVVDAPPKLESDLLAGRGAEIQVKVDATAMTQAGLGAVYLQQILTAEARAFLKSQDAAALAPFRAVSRLRFNPNGESAWFTSVMQVVTDATVLGIILTGAAVIREREHGTIEHLLVLPVSAGEIAVAKIVANGCVILAAALLSLWLVVQVWLGVPLEGSIALFAACLALYLFSVTSLGMALATFAPTMQQFGLLAVPVYAVAYLLSGAATPVENMPDALQAAVRFLPTTQFVRLSQAILFRGAGIGAIWPSVLAIVASSALFLALALSRFRAMLASQG